VITHFVVGVGTGGTISGIGRYFKKKIHIKIWGIDTYGFVFKNTMYVLMRTKSIPI
jgi:cystathionine beta-synthase